MYYNGYSVWRYILYAVIIILLVGGFIFLVVGSIYIYYHCMFIKVSDLPGYCLTFL